MRRTRGSSALRMATPPSSAVGSASTSSAFASSIASSDPMRERWTGWTAVTIPIDGCPIAASSRISPPVYMPISSTAASWAGPRSSTVSGMPTSLLRLPSVRKVANRCSRTPATASFVDVLAMLPVTPMTSGEKRRRHAAAVACRPRSVSGTSTTVTSPSASSGGSSGQRLAAHEQRRGTGRDGLAQVPVAVRPLAGQRDEQGVARHEAGVDGAAADRAVAAPEEAPARRPDEVLGGHRRGGIGGAGGTRGRAGDRRPSGFRHGVECRTGGGHG